jgi:cobalt-zinc-cadmium efflux system protein
MAILVLVMAAMRLRHPIEIPTAPMLIAAAGGLVTELISLRLLYGGQKGDLI